MAFKPDGKRHNKQTKQISHSGSATGYSSHLFLEALKMMVSTDF